MKNIFPITGYCGLYEEDASETLKTGNFEMITRHLGRGIYFYVSPDERTGHEFSLRNAFADDVLRSKKRRLRSYEKIACVTAEITCKDDEWLDLRDENEKLELLETVKEVLLILHNRGTDINDFKTLYINVLETMVKAGRGIQVVVSDFHPINLDTSINIVCVTSHRNIEHCTIKLRR